MSFVQMVEIWLSVCGFSPGICWLIGSGMRGNIPTMPSVIVTPMQNAPNEAPRMFIAQRPTVSPEQWMARFICTETPCDWVVWFIGLSWTFCGCSPVWSRDVIVKRFGVSGRHGDRRSMRDPDLFAGVRRLWAMVTACPCWLTPHGAGPGGLPRRCCQCVCGCAEEGVRGLERVPVVEICPKSLPGASWAAVVREFGGG